MKQEKLFVYPCVVKPGPIIMALVRALIPALLIEWPLF